MSFEDREFTRQQVIHSLRLCADSGDCKNCDFFEAECPRGYNPCHEFKMMELAADFIEEKTVKVKDIIGKWGHCECGTQVFHPDDWEWKYCPHCGAKMEWE